MKKFLSILLMLCMFLSLLPLQTFAADIVATDTSDLSEYVLGDIVEFGSYPQSEVTDEETLVVLNTLDLDWVSYDYYFGTGNYGTMMADDYMKYADITWKGKIYRAVTFSQYRPHCTWFESSLSNSYQDAYGYNTNAVYWFEFQPIKWRVLDPSEGLVVCETLIDAQPYSNSIYYQNKEYWMDSECSLYGNDYAESSIKAWLNHTFYTTAFNSVQQSKILETQLDNTAYGDGTYAKYDADDTTDKVFLLSFDDVFNVTYGFTGDESRQANISDYAICQGVKVDPTYGRSDYFLRTAGAPGSNACGISATGGSSYKHPVYQVSCIRPAMCISSLAIDGIPDDDSTADIGAATVALQTIDYLAFADLAYIPISNIDPNSTVKHMICSDNKNWDDNWKSTDIKYSELFGNIADWTLCGMKENAKTGFGVYAFKNDSGQVVIAYRGSVSMKNLGADDWWADWVQNDFYMFCGAEGTQVSDAIEFTTLILDAFGAENVSMTGHSLGGGICEIMSAMFGCYAETFNAAPFLDIAFTSYPEEMSQIFDGVENLNCIDHIVKGDAVGDLLGTVSKNAYFYEKSSYTKKSHGLDAFVQKSKDNHIGLTPCIQVEPLTEAYSAKQFLAKAMLCLGTSGNDRFTAYSFNNSVYAFGGDGSDRMLGSTVGDVLAGGTGTDFLDGGPGDDEYYYCQGDGMNIIYDSAGDDIIKLIGEDLIGNISIECTEDYVGIVCEGEPIVMVYKNRCNGTLFVDNNGMRPHLDLTPYLTINEKLHTIYSIACPVNVQIINDSTGEVMLTLYDKQEMTEYTDYGYFYVYEQDGEYVKAADLFEGYSIRIVGTDTGTMNVIVCEESGEDEYTVLSLIDIPVTNSFVASCEDADGEYYLHIDADGDGVVEQIIELVNVNTTESPFENSTIHFEANGGTEISDVTAINGRVISRPIDPTKDGKYFVGWFKDINCTEEWCFETDTVSGNMTLYAKWSDTTVDETDIEQPTADDGFNYIWLLTIIPILLIIIFLIKKIPKEKH